MGGRLLIIGGAASARIVLKARLSAACYDVTSVSEGATGLHHAAGGGFHAVLADMDLPDIPAPDLIHRLRAMPGMAEVPLIALAALPDPVGRIAALEAGADDVLTQPGEGILLARLRNLLRHRATLADLGANAAPMHSLGFAEGAAGFDGPAHVTLVMGRSETALRLRRDLSAHLPGRITMLPASEALNDAALTDENPTVPDVFVIDTDMDDTGGGLRLLAELRSRSAGRHAAFCLLRPTSAAVHDPMAFDLGASDVIDPATDPREVALRLRRVLARKRAADHLRASVRDGLRLAVTDPLTGLHNRRYAVSRLTAIAGAAQADGSTIAVMIVDLDRFKRVNDEWGHAAGDAVLVQVAQRLASAMRPGDLLARIGGEEFLVALPGTGLIDARHIAERLLMAVQEQPITLPQGRHLHITASIGLALSEVAEFRQNETVQAVLDRADQALLVAKSCGRNQITVGRTAA
jgi:two-component system, cell cycle response regulator